MNEADPTAFVEPEARVDGALKLTGAAHYAGDYNLPGTLQAKFLTSPLPHALIRSIDTTRARAVPGVHAVLTGADIGPRRFGKVLYDQPVLAYQRVRFVGERVAAVAAESAEAAEEAVGLLTVEYDDLPAVFDGEKALRDDAPILHPGIADYHYTRGERPRVPHPNLQGYGINQKGAADLGPLFASAYRVFEHVYHQGRQHQGYLEPHACLVWIDDQDIVHVYSTNKAAFALRQSLAVCTGLPAQQIVVNCMFVGGDFGGKGSSIDEFACYYLAKATGRPIKSVMTYADELSNANPRHASTCHLKTAVDESGRMIAHEARIYFHDGAYASGRPQDGTALLGGAVLDGYAIPNRRVESFTVYTNTAPGGQMRSTTNSTTMFIGESHVDEIARELGVDPLDFRILNAAGGNARQSGAVRALETLRRETDWGKPLPPNRGRGLSVKWQGPGAGRAATRVRLLDDGTIEILHGAPEQGGGSATVTQRVGAAALGVALNRVQVRYGDTGEAPPNPGAGGSRLTHVLGQAAVDGASALRSRLEKLAAGILGWPGDQVRLENDEFRVAGSGPTSELPTRNSELRVPFDDLVERMLHAGGAEATGTYDSSELGHGDGSEGGYCAYMVEVEVDPETGQVRPTDVVLVVETGTVINPVGHQGQLDGAFVFGLGNALTEEIILDDGKVGTLSLGEYKLPTIADVPPLRTVLAVEDNGWGPFGAKAVGEMANNPVAPAVANAIADAVGARVRTVPFTAERVLEAIHRVGA
jgi:CO/xanthine dehydrogenase Mo-binding subunit